MSAKQFGSRTAQPTRSSVRVMLAWCLGLLLCPVGLSAAAADLNVEVKNVKPKQGVVVVALFDKPSDFPVAAKRLAARVVEAGGESITVTFQGLGAGRYAVAAFQDENRNGKLDKNFLGLPTEPYGFSNDARGSMGPPSFDKAAIDLATTLNIVIHLH